MQFGAPENTNGTDNFPKAGLFPWLALPAFRSTPRKPVLRIRGLFDPWIRDPMNNPDHVSESLKNSILG